MEFGGKVLSYSYDEDGNITEIKENNVLKESYSYDDLGQMVRENNLDNNQTILYTYDGSGNILSKTTYPYTVGGITAEGTVVTYTYGNSSWKDLLTAYNGEAITYDKIGNPLKYRSGMQFQWDGGRKLTSFSTPNAVGSYVYNSDGIRVYKEVNGNKTEYYLNGTEIQTEITNFGGITRRVDYIYDENGSIYGFVVDNTAKYYYTKNLQGDIIGILDNAGTQIVKYTYDAWGKATISYPNTANLTETQKQARYLLGSNNPFRYRGYYFDNETGFYYVSSRYYDPEIGRWINADNQIAGVGGEVLGYNMFAYCMNNPVNMSDPSGNWPKWATKLVAAVAVVAVVAVVAAVTVATAGAGTAIAAVAVGAAKGAAIGFAVGAATGAAGGAISHRISTGSWDGAGEAALNGMANGALSGAVSGAITGGITGGLSYNSGATSAGKGFDTYRQLKNEIGSPGAGNEWHHIVEQSQIAKSGFSPQMIQNTNNIMSISKTTHRAISGYYSSVQPFTNGMIVRNWLAGQSFSAQYEFGVNVIKMFM